MYNAYWLFGCLVCFFYGSRFGYVYCEFRINKMKGDDTKQYGEWNKISKTGLPKIKANGEVKFLIYDDDLDDVYLAYYDRKDKHFYSASSGIYPNVTHYMVRPNKPL